VSISAPELEYLAQEISKRTAAQLAPFALKERWLPRKAYAKHYGVSTQAVYRRTKKLRAIKAAQGKGRAVRYDVTVSPHGVNLLKQN